MEYHTLLLSSDMRPHRVVDWRTAICKLVEGEIEVLENHDGDDAVVCSPSISFVIPSVARIRTYVPVNKKGVKFSRENVLSRDNYRCNYCGEHFARRQLNYDHVIPRCQGGKTVWQNVTTACLPCNSKKGGRTPEQAKMRLLRKPERPQWLPLQMPTITLKSVPEEWGFYLQGLPHLKHAFGLIQRPRLEASNS
jgi:5-methylcytosine-specific restriction endonuclease McrA